MDNDLRRISLVIPCFNEEEAIPSLLERLRGVAAGMPEFAFEFLFVDDGSSDGTATVLTSARAQDERIAVVQLSRNFGKEAALTAGLDFARGDAVIPIDADLQHPPELIADMIRHWQQGYEVVLARRINRKHDSRTKRASARWFYRLHNAIADINIPDDVGDFRLLDRMVVDALAHLPERRRFMKGLFAWVGFHTATIDYEPNERSAGTSKFSGWRLWNFALEGITSFSTVPLRIWTYIGALVSCGALFYALYFAVRTLIQGNEVPGYPSLLVSIYFLGGIQLIGIGVIGEYVGRAYQEAKQRPLYLVRRQLGCVRAGTRERQLRMDRLVANRHD